MKRLFVGCVWILLGIVGTAVFAAEPAVGSTGDTKFIAYDGKQDWPVANDATVLKDFAVPIFVGLPPKRYIVLGRIEDSRRTGLGAIDKVFSDGFDDESTRRRYCANLAKKQGGHALVLTNHEKVLSALKLTPKLVKENSPMATSQHNVVLVIKFD